MDWIKIIMAINILILSQAALKYGNGNIAALIATLPVIGLTTYLSAKDPSKVALYLAVFMLTGSAMFFVLHFLPDKRYLPIGIVFWFLLSYSAFRIVI